MNWDERGSCYLEGTAVTVSQPTGFGEWGLPSISFLVPSHPHLTPPPPQLSFKRAVEKDATTQGDRFTPRQGRPHTSGGRESARRKHRSRKRRPEAPWYKVPQLPTVELMRINEIINKPLLATLPSWFRVTDTFIFVLKFSDLTEAQAATSTNDTHFWVNG